MRSDTAAAIDSALGGAPAPTTDYAGGDARPITTTDTAEDQCTLYGTPVIALAGAGKGVYGAGA